MQTHAALLSGLLFFSPPASDLPALATKAVVAMSQGRNAEVVAGFDDTMKGALPAEKLGAVWGQLTSQAGAFKSVGGTREADASGYRIVLVRCHFERGDLDAKVVFDANAKIAGLFFVPASGPEGPVAAATATPLPLPPYADAAKFKEVAVTVGTDPWKLPGILSLPVGVAKAPAVVLVHGSGPNDADETIGENKPFRDLATGLASRGIAVLRYEKRTHAYGPQMAKLPQLTIREETEDDAIAAVELLSSRPEIDPTRIWVLGHSLGGTAAPRIATRSKKVAGLVLLAGATRSLPDAIVQQLTYIASLDGTIDDTERTGIAAAESFRKQVASKDLKPTDTLDVLGAKIPGSYFLDLRSYDPAATAATLDLPILVLQGTGDYQVTMDDFAAWKKALEKRPRARLKTFDGLSHLFMPASAKPSPADYAKAGHVDVTVIQTIADFIAPANR